MNLKLPIPTAKDINEAHRAAWAAAEITIKHAIRCGQLLIAKKADLHHGDFQQWVDKNCEFAYSTGARYMKAAKANLSGVEVSSLSRLFPSGRAETKQRQKAASSTLPAPLMDKEDIPTSGAAAAVGLPKPEQLAVAKEKPKVAAAFAAPIPADNWEPDEDEEAKAELFERNHAASVDKILAADDRLAAATEEIKRLNAAIATLTISRNGFQNQCGELIRRIKRLQSENERLKRAA